MFRLVAFFVLLLGSAVKAAEIVVEAGEHADFSRLVLQLPKAGDWSFGKVAEGYELRLQSAENRFDFSQIFQKIPKTRIAAVTSSAGDRVRLAVDCNCHADAFEIRNGRIVLDIKDGPPSPGSVFEQPLKDPAAAVEAEIVAMEPLLPPSMPEPRLRDSKPPVTRPAPDEFVPIEVELPAPAASADRNVSKTVPISLDSQVLPLFGFGSSPLGGLEPGADARLDLLEEALILQLGRASAQGLIQVAPGTAIPRRSPAADTASARAPADASDQPPEVIDTPSQHFRIETAQDRAAPPKSRESMTNFEGGECLSDTHFDVAAWGPKDRGYGLSIAMDRSVLGEFDVPLEAEVEAAVRHYVHLGFGVEAKALLSAFTAKIDRADILWQLADIVDDPGSGRAVALRTQISCDTTAALWAVLSLPALQRGEPVAAAAVLQNFSGFPIHLRQHLGPELAERFLEAGDPATATSIRNMITRNSAVPAAGAGLLQARIDAELGKAEASLEQLRKVVSEGGPDAAEALVELIDAKFDAGQTVDPLTSQLAEAFAYESRGTEIGRRLTLTAIRGMIASLRLEAAFEAISDAEKDKELTPEEAAELLGKAHLSNAKDSTNVEFLRLLQRFGNPQDSPEIRPARLAAATRLLDLGFSGHVRAMLASGQQPPDNEDKGLLARAALLEKKADIALSYLVGLSDDSVKGLRARALEMADHPAEAAELYEDGGQSTDAARAAWKSGDWEMIAALGTDRQRSAADLFAAPPLADPAEEKAAADTLPAEGEISDAASVATVTLQNGRALLERSQSARDAIAGLLEGNG